MTKKTLVNEGFIDLFSAVFIILNSFLNHRNIVGKIFFNSTL